MTFLQRLGGGRGRSKGSKANDLSLKGLDVVELPNRPVPTSHETSRGQEYWRSFNEAEAQYRSSHHTAALKELTRLDGSGPLHKTGYALYLRCLRKVRKALVEEGKLSSAAEISRKILDHPELKSTATDERAHNKIVGELGGFDSDMAPVRARPKLTTPADLIEVSSELGWVVDQVIQKDTAGKGVSPWKHRAISNNGTIEISPRGLPPRPEQLGDQRARVRYHDIGGAAQEFDLDHVAYRIGTHPYSGVFATLSEHSLDLVVRELSGQLLTVTPLRNEVGDGIEGKYQVRCVAANRRGSLFTVISKAVLSSPANRIWFVRTPAPPGVERRIEQRGGRQLSREVEEAAIALGVQEGADLEHVRRAYRAAAMRSHPDRNPGDPHAQQKMVELNAAYELLTSESARLAWETEDEIEVYYTSVVRTSVDMGQFGTMEIEFAMRGFGGDWIYAAALSEEDEYAYLGCYSGRVFVVDRNGDAVGVLNVGQPVRALTPLGAVLLIETDTRVFAVEGSSLLAEIDIWEKGSLTYFPDGLIFQVGNSLHVHDATGALTGRIEVKEPIRGFWRAGMDLQIETNKSTAAIGGVFGASSP